MVATTGQPSVKAPPDHFTGDAWVDSITSGVLPGGARLARVWFAPGARTAWPRHVLGQTLHATDGHGLVQSRGRQAVRLDPGVTVYTHPGVWHWHGALQDRSMCHLALSDSAAGQAEPDVEWGQPVTDAEAARAAAAARGEAAESKEES